MAITPLPYGTARMFASVGRALAPGLGSCRSRPGFAGPAAFDAVLSITTRRENPDAAPMWRGWVPAPALVAPLFGTAPMVHLLKQMQKSAP